MSMRAYVSQHLTDTDDDILAAVNATIEQVKVAPLATKATEELIKKLSELGTIDKATELSLTEWTVQDISIASQDLGRLATLEDIIAVRAALVSQVTETLVRDAATRRINQLWANIGKCLTDADVIKEFSA